MLETEQRSLSATHRNNGLFADYYLNEIVPTLTEWDDATLVSQATVAYDELRRLRERIQPESLDEAQLEEQWVKPVLDALNMSYSVQVKVRYRERGHRKPDYVFVGSDADARALTSEIYDPEQIAHALAVGDAKRWGVNLDQSAPGQRNPAQQIDEYLRYSELPWGILTDGRTWRLYHRDTSKYNTYYAVDLDQLLDADNLNNFLYFYAFFRKEAFTSGWLVKVLAGSEDFAQKLTDKLEDEVYEALEMIAQGFLDYRRNQLSADATTLRTIYENSLVLLYRLLFIFYAESREILPMFDNETYTNQRSLTAIKRRVAHDLDFNRSLNADSSSFYNGLQDLFFAIDAGDPSLDLPPYNGKLFADRQHPFLADNVVGDAYLVPALDKLARVDVTENRRQKRVFVDYRDLDVRHLGSIYEKLLEYELAVADQPLMLKGQQYVPAKKAEDALKQAGQVYLRTGSNERKVTGSYYTPDYIVRFIVEKTLEPLLTDITGRHATLDEDGQWHVQDADGLVAEVLALNVLDPATGSGHFVVDVTSYIAEWLTALSLRPHDLGDEDELIYWKRLVASACIYAVDINPLAVELAKLSMWLTTLAKGKPLSFLDHHIRVGNSLVGASLSDFDDAEVDVKAEKNRQRRIQSAEKRRREAEAAGQATLFDLDDFTEGVRFAV
ncbi:MAG: class I SAM-dependent DNA methyltransferase, partial [Anaerolineae bacterium]|nr:class I SAM-dependent DNA methyltransferase [Anaerolineae bacterium]